MVTATRVRPDKAARDFFEEYGVGLVFHAREGRRLVGHLWMHVLDLDEEEDVDDSCLASLDELAARHPEMRRNLVGRVRVVFVDEAYRSKGVGSALYVAAAEAMKKRRAAIMADGCFEDGRTSEYALKVWLKSRELRRACDVQGLAAYYSL